jgi:hypothetical protein
MESLHILHLDTKGRRTLIGFCGTIKQLIRQLSEWIEIATDPRPLGYFRACFGILCLVNLALMWPDMPMWLGDDGVLPPLTHAATMSGFRINIYTLTGYSDNGIWIIRCFGLVGGLSLLLGFFPRIGALLSWLAIVSYSWRNIYILHSGDALLRVGCFFLIFAKSAEAFSVPAFLRSKKSTILVANVSATLKPLIAAWPQRILQLQLCATYLVTGFWKSIGRPWQDGSAVGTVLQLGEFQRFPLPDILITPLGSEMMTYTTLAVELGFPFLVWIPKLRPYVLLVGLTFHLGLEWALNVQMFQWTILSFYLLFIDPRWFARDVLRRKFRRITT